MRKYAGRVLNLLLDEFDSGVANGTKRDTKVLRQLINEARYSGVKFVIPNFKEINDDQPVTAAELRPPFPVTVIEFDFDEIEMCAMMVAKDEGDRVTLFVSSRNENFDGIVWYISPALVYAKYSDLSAISIDPIWHSAPMLSDRVNSLITATDGDIAQAAEFVLSAAMKFIRAYVAMCQTLKHRHVETIDVEPDVKENRVRRIKGKTPMFTYKTLVIGEPKPQIKTRKGGTHASPRSHLRRGHYRTGKNGNRYWVSAAFVNGAPGFVHKDYELKLGAQ